MRKVVIGGVGMTSFGKFLERNLKSLAEESVSLALKDARVSVNDVDRIFFGNAAAGVVTGQEMIRAQSSLRNTGLDGKPMFNIENACASGSSALNLAWLSVASGQSETALVVGVEKLTHEDKAISFGAFAKAVDLEEPLPEGVTTGTGSLFMDLYAAKARKWMEKTGAEASDFARVVVKSRRAGSLNPHAQFRNETSVEEVLASRMVSDPLTLFMCSSIGDGGAAVFICSEQFAAKRDIRPVYIRASSIVSAKADGSGELVAVRAANAAYEQAGIGPSDVHVVELHDASAPAELIHYENLGLCAPGDAPKLIRSGDTDIGGRISVNPSGGLLSRGHPVGATGVAQIVELTQQLRGTAGARQRPGAKVALAENNGGQLAGDSAVALVTILST
ncbi:thiolase family protein [Paraburkholderia hospita]|jgi:acetyl-CoA acetyltransferase|uniref:propanoyl-CoA C-acyltransferase n=1 Tax=Paraburkholderia hospita TaxID=169430 RepID=A0AAJ4SST5_9BURK|nr:thiolase family protein [Paraburkholderia hospita]SOE85205.1 Acetyl-CoA acetyltransferase [Burkholderia sp. YR290]AUT70462.1 thiolase family protein [Paraburkholderia hospita]AXF01461.1 thiolase family protein [Paraburkholderia hospita]EIM99911.1 thiolase [Paraburkholderia hospita]OUL83052.1 thiolase [Paraburkholderia hospita]